MRVVATGGLVASAQDSAANKPFTPDGIGSTHISTSIFGPLPERTKCLDS